MPRRPTLARVAAASSVESLLSAVRLKVGACWMMVLLMAYLNGGWLLGPVDVSLMSDLRIEFCG